MADKHPGIPVKQTTLDMATGKGVEKEVRFGLLPLTPRAGVCAECGTKHREGDPHNAQSLFYQYHFYGLHERWPTWLDAMAHCDQKVQDLWVEALKVKGVDVAAGKLTPTAKDD